MGFLAYALSLLVSTYSGTGVGIGINLPLEQRGPLIAFAFLSAGYFLTTDRISTQRVTLFVMCSAAMVFAESMALSVYFHVPFLERPYLFSTLPLAIGLLLFAASNPSLGAKSIVSRIGNRSLGVYLVHTPVLGGFTQIRSLFVHPIWEVFFPIMVLICSYAVVLLFLKVPFLGKTVQ
jgi:peptidoglycan/LPS O-acetylase OafA/YrhL